jgi:hypothetical protein
MNPRSCGTSLAGAGFPGWGVFAWFSFSFFMDSINRFFARLFMPGL